MSFDIFLCCEKCFEYKYAGDKRYFLNQDESFNLSKFIYKHIYECDGNLYALSELCDLPYPKKIICEICDAQEIINGGNMGEQLYPTKKCKKCKKI